MAYRVRVHGNTKAFLSHFPMHIVHAFFKLPFRLSFAILVNVGELSRMGVQKRYNGSTKNEKVKNEQREKNKE